MGLWRRASQDVAAGRTVGLREPRRFPFGSFFSRTAKRSVSTRLGNGIGMAVLGFFAAGQLARRRRLRDRQR